MFYRYELWHRGSAMKPAGLRIMHSFAFRRATAPWLGGVACGYGLEASRMPREWMGTLSTQQREKLGFPSVNDPYWTRDTILGVRQHYGHDFDVAPYETALLGRLSEQAQGEAIAQRQATMAAHTAAAAAEPRVTLPPAPGRWHFNPATPWFAPEAPASASQTNPLSAAQIGRWHEDGLLVLQGLLPATLTEQAVAAGNPKGGEHVGHSGDVGQFPYPK